MNKTASKSYPSFKIVSSTEQDSWDKFIASSVFSNLSQNWHWGEMLTSKQISIERFAVMVDKKIVIAAQCLISKELVSGSVLYLTHGPIFANAKELEEYQQVFFSGLFDYCNKNKCRIIKLRPPVLNNTNDFSLPESLSILCDPLLVNILKKQGFTNKHYKKDLEDFYLLDLTLPERKLFKLFSAEAQENMFFAVDNGIEIISFEGRVNGFVNKMNALIRKEVGRNNIFTNHPQIDLNKIKSNFKGTNILEIFQASLGPVEIETAICYFFGYLSTLFFRVKNTEYKLLDIENILTWAAVKEAKKRGCKAFLLTDKYDLDRINAYHLQSLGVFEKVIN